MNLRPMRPDTVDRIRPTECFRLDGKVWGVESVALAPTVARPARVALTVIDPAGSMAQTGEVIYLDAGEIVTQTWDPRIDRPTADDLAQVEPDGTAAEGTCQSLVYVGGWDYVEPCGNTMPCHEHGEHAAT